MHALRKRKSHLRKKWRTLSTFFIFIFLTHTHKHLHVELKATCVCVVSICSHSQIKVASCAFRVSAIFLFCIFKKGKQRRLRTVFAAPTLAGARFSHRDRPGVAGFHVFFKVSPAQHDTKTDTHGHGHTTLANPGVTKLAASQVQWGT